RGAGAGRINYSHRGRPPRRPRSVFPADFFRSSDRQRSKAESARDDFDQVTAHTAKALRNRRARKLQWTNRNSGARKAKRTRQTPGPRTGFIVPSDELAARNPDPVHAIHTSNWD